MRKAIAMIELIFAMVIIAITVISIPSMMSIASASAKTGAIDDDILSRLFGWTLEKSQARFDQNYDMSNGNAAILMIPTMADLGCSRSEGNITAGTAIWYRENNDSRSRCNENNLTPSVIPVLGDGNLSRGIEQLNGGSETLVIPTSSNTQYDVNATYAVAYVNSAVTINGNRETTTWQLGSADNMMVGGSLNVQTHLKRVCVRFRNADLGSDIVLSFFKSNK